MKSVEVSAAALSRDALRALVEEFVTRDGTDYGAVERSLDAKVADVLRQLDRGEVRIVFDPESETTRSFLFQPPRKRQTGGGRRLRAQRRQPPSMVRFFRPAPGVNRSAAAAVRSSSFRPGARRLASAVQ
jgi:uncharacterized protein YheU (UPF0270 family)